MDTATLAEFRGAVDQLGKGFEAFKTEHTKSLKDRDVLLEEKMKKIADDVAANHETALRLIREEVAKEQRPAAATAGDQSEETKQASQFAVHRKSLQAENINSLRNTYGNEFPGFDANLDAYRSYRKAFIRYLQVGDRLNLSLMGTDMQKDMSIGIDPDGGYFLLPPTVSQRVVQRMFETSPMREISNVMPISTRAFDQPVDPSDINAGWVAERTTRTTTTTITPTKVEIPAQELYAEPALSQQLLEDSAIDVDTYVGNRLADKFERVENTAFVSGTGQGQPFGFLSYPTVVVTSGNFSAFGKLEQVNSGSSGEFTYVGLIKLVTSLKESFQRNATFLIRRQSVYYILGLTDGNGRLIFQPLVNGNLNNTPLLGYTLRYATDMPDVAAGANAMAFGDFKQGYTIVDRVGMSVLRDPYTAKPFVLLYTRKRTGGAVVDFDAIKIHSLQ